MRQTYAGITSGVLVCIFFLAIYGMDAYGSYTEIKAKKESTREYAKGRYDDYCRDAHVVVRNNFGTACNTFLEEANMSPGWEALIEVVRSYKVSLATVYGSFSSHLYVALLPLTAIGVLVMYKWAKTHGGSITSIIDSHASDFKYNTPSLYSSGNCHFDHNGVGSDIFSDRGTKDKLA
jgi:hypothetical protein